MAYDKNITPLFATMAALCLTARMTAAQDHAEAAVDTQPLYDSQTARAEYIGHLQQRFGTAAHHPVIILDKSWFDLNTAMRNIETEPDEYSDAEAALMKHYIDSHLDGMEVSQSIAGLFYRDLTLEYPQALPHNYPGSKFWSSDDHSGKFCLLYPSVPELDNDHQTKAMIYYRPEIYGSLYGHALTPVLSYEEHTKLNDYHELAHCLDKRYMMDYMEGRANGSQKVFLENRHLLELKGELLGVLLMVKYEHADDLAGRRSHERYLDSWFRGRALARSAFDIMQAHSGATYAFGPALERLQDEIDTIGADRIRQMDLPALAARADEIAEEAALSAAQKNILVQAYKNPEHKARISPFLDNYLDKVAMAFVTLTGGAADKAQVRESIYNEAPGTPDDHYQYEPSRQTGAARENAIGMVTKDFAELAGNNPSSDGVAAAYSALYDRYLEQIGSAGGEAAARTEAMNKMRVLQEATRRLIHEPQAPVPAAGVIAAPGPENAF